MTRNDCKFENNRCKPMVKFVSKIISRKPERQIVKQVKKELSNGTPINKIIKNLNNASADSDADAANSQKKKRRQ